MRLLCLSLLFFCSSLAVFAQEAACGDGIDNDGDGFIDCFDGDCRNNAVCKDFYLGQDITCQATPTSFPGFSMKLEKASADKLTYTSGRLAIGDLDKDGIPEVVTIQPDDKKIYILNGQDLSIKYTGNVTGTAEYFDQAIADIKGDGCGDIFIAEVQSGKYYITSYDCQGNKQWSTQAYGQPITFGIADFGSDGKPEIYYRNEILDAATGTRLVKGSGTWTALDAGSLAVDMLTTTDCAGCAGLELVLGAAIYSVNLGARTLDAGTIKLEKSIPASASYFPKYSAGFAYTTSLTSVADYNQDGFLDVLTSGSTGSTTGTTTAFFWDVKNNTAKTYAPSTNWAHGTGRLNISDIDGDGKLNTTFVSGGRVFALKEDFTLLWSLAINETTSGYTSATVFDFNNDKSNEVVYRDEKFLYIIDGKTGTVSTKNNCASRTANEYPIVVDVDADGATEICITCATNDNIDINTVANRYYGQVRVFSSNGSAWVPARKLWNQHGYFNVNVNDNLTIPQVQQLHNTVFSVGSPCNPGSNRPLNSFLNQSPFLDSKGCPTYAAPDLIFDPNSAITINPPTCPDQDFTVSFTIKNIGDLGISGTLPITFYNGDPTKAGAVKLNTVNLNVSSLNVNNTNATGTLTVNGTGTSFTLYMVLNDNGSTVPTPISLPNTTFAECNYANNYASATVTPNPFAISTGLISDNFKCANVIGSPNGAVESYRLVSGVKQTVNYTFYWFNGATVADSSLAAYKGAIYSGLSEGTYSVFAAHKGFKCVSNPQSITVAAQTRSLSLNIIEDKPFTNCKNPNGKLHVEVNGGDPIGNFTYEWYLGNDAFVGAVLSKSHELTNADALTYTVVVTEKATLCPSIRSYQVTDNATRPVVTATAVAANCTPANSGSASATVAGATAGYTFNWYNGSSAKPVADFTGSTYANISVGSYSVTATDNSSGCVSPLVTTTVSSKLIQPVSASVTAQQTSCKATKNGAASANVAGVTAGFTWKWFAGNGTALPVLANSPTISSLAAGVYTVQATDAAGCSDTEIVTIVDNISTPTVSTSINSHQTNCIPGNGSTTASGAGSAGPFQYYWFNGNVGSPDTTTYNFKGATYAGLAAGFYTVVDVDKITRCASARAVVQILDNTVSPTVAASTVNQTGCIVASPNGGATASVTSPAGSYKYRWWAGTDTTLVANFIGQAASISNRAAGTYTVKAVSLSTGCFSTRLVTITDAKVLPVVSLSSTNNSICNAALTSPSVSYNGTVTATVTNQVGAITGYTFSFGGGAGVQGSSPAHNTFTQLNGATTYTATATQTSTGCVSATSSVLVLNAPTLPVLTTGNTGSTNCVAGKEDGKATVVTVNGSAAPATGFTYSWSGPVAPSFPLTAANNPNTSQLINVQGGAGYSYTVQVTDQSNGCQSTAVVAVADAKVLPVVSLSSTSNSICNVALTSPSVSYNGTVTATVTNQIGAITGYTFSFGGGAGVQGSSPAHNTFTQLNGATTYTATATQTSTGCVSATGSVLVLNAPTLPVLTTSNTASTNCVAGKEDGKATVVTVNGSAAPATGFTYSWSGPVAPSFPVTAANNPNTSQLIKVQGGAGYSYTVQVTDQSNGCQSTAVVAVADAKVLPVVSLSSTNNSICNVALTSPSVSYNGTVTATVTNQIGAITGYTFSFGGGAGVQGSSPAHNTFTQLNGATTYTATATQTSTGCVSATGSVLVLNAPTLPVLTTSNTASTNCVAGKEDGKATVVTVNGSAAPAMGFTYSWSGPAAPSFPVTAANNPNTSQLIKVQGGAGYSYTVQVTDQSNGCQSTAVVAVADAKVLPVVSLSSTNNSICNVALTSPSVSYNGTVTATVTNQIGAITGYTFSFGGGAGVQGSSPAHNTFTQLNGATTYTATATQTSTGCVSATGSVLVLNATTPPVLATSNTASTNCVAGKEDGKATVVTVNGSAASASGFTYSWTGPVSFPVTAVANASNTSQLINVQGGAGYNYTVQVTDQSNGCQNTAVVNVADAKVLPTLTLNPTSNSICNPALTSPSVSYNGAVTATVTNQVGAITGYTFSFGGGAGVQGSSPTHNTFTQLNGGITYTVTGTQTATGCTSSVVSSFVSNNLTYPVLLTSADASTNCVAGKENGAANVNSVDGLIVGMAAAALTNYTYQWYDGNTVNPLNIKLGSTNPTLGSTTPGLGIQGGLSSSTFTALVTRKADGCQSNIAITIPDAKANPVVTASTIQNNTMCVGADGSLVALVTYKGVAQPSPLAANWTITWQTIPATVPTIGETYFGLAAGNYSVSATDTNTGCVSAVATGTIVDQPDIPVLSTTVVNKQTSCDLLSPVGKLQGSATNGPLGSTLKFTWYDGMGTGGAIIASAAGQVSGANLQTLANLPTNNYTFEAVNEITGCKNTSTILLPQQLTYPTFTGAVTDVTACVPSNGQVDITLGTITNPLQYTIYYLEEVNFAHTGDPALVKSSATSVKVPTDPSPLSYVGLVPAHKLIPGTYTVLVTDEVSHCDSSPVTFTVQDKTNKTVTVSAIVQASACNSGLGGKIDISVSPVLVLPAAYSYQWYAGVPTNNSFNFMNNANLPNFAAGMLQTTEDLDGYTAADHAGVGTGLYTVVITDNVGCGKVYSDNVPFVGAPDVLLTLKNSTKCDPLLSDASIKVDVSNVFPGIKYSVRLFKGHDSAVPLTWINGEDDQCNDGIDNDGDGFIDLLDSDCSNGSSNFSTTFVSNGSALPTNPSPVAPLLGDYLVRVFDNSGVGCAIEKVVTLQIAPKLPQVTTVLTPSTACTGGVGDGTVQLTVKKDPLDTTVPIYSLTAISPANISGAIPQAIPEGIPTMVTGTFSAQPYTLTISDAVSGCSVDQFVSIPSQPELPTAFIVTPTHDELCSPSTNGSALVTTLTTTTPSSFTDFNFGWYKDNALATPVVAVAPGDGLGTGGELLTSAKVNAFAGGNWPLGLAGSGNGNKTFYVRAQKQNAPGDKCFTPIVQVKINDTHSAPELNLLSYANTSCDIASPEGSIEIKASTTSSNGIIASALYTYSWSVAAGSPVAGQNGGVAYTIGNLATNTYAVTALNEQSGCTVSRSTDVLDTKFNIAVTDKLITDQDICPVGGQIDITEIQMDRGITGQSTMTFSGASLSTDFTYEWFKAPVGSPGTFNSATPLQDALPATISQPSLVTGGGAQQLASMSYGTYYVIATRTTSALPGKLCATQPFRVDVLDKREFPSLNFSSLPSTSCDANYDGAITVSATTSGFSAGTLYNFDWTSNPGGAVVITDGIGVLSPHVNKSEALGGPVGERIGAGTYGITVTNTVNNCSTNGSVDVQQNTVPVAVTSANSSPLTHCTAPDGSVQVLTVDVNGDSVALGNFSFVWTGSGGGPYATSTVSNLSAGDYFVTATKTVAAPVTATTPASGCSSSPFKVVVSDSRQFPTLSFSSLASTSCDADYDGSITVSATTTGLGGASYNFDWTSAPGGSVITDGVGISPHVNESEALGGPVGERIGAGTYGITVTNTVNNCSTNGSVDVQQNTVPVAVTSASSSPLTHCTAPDGSVQVLTVDVNNAAAALGNFSFVWTSSGGGSYATSTVSNLSAGDYFVTATKTVAAPVTATTPASGCTSSPFKVVVSDSRQFPTLSFSSLASTSCDANYDGSITVSATTSGFSAGTLYNFDWTSNPGGAVVITDGIGVLSPRVNESEALGGPVGERIGAGTYGITVTNTVNNCSTNGSVDVQQNTVPVAVTSASSSPLTHCTAPDGSVSVLTVTVNNVAATLADFSFGWTSSGGSYATSTVSNLSAGDYFVTATKTVAAPVTATTPASGCSSSPFKVVVSDSRQFPTLSFSSLASTSCDANYDGSITVSATTTGLGGASYNFDWTSAPGGSVITDGVGLSPHVNKSEALGGSVGERIGAGTYGITVTNTVNNCSTNGSVDVQQNIVPVAVTSASSSPLTNCTAPNGSVSVLAVTVNNVAATLADFSFGWTSSGGSYATSTVSNLSAGDYFVTATKTVAAPVTATTPASGCTSSPFKVVVSDSRQFPTLSFSSLASTSCDANYDGSITVSATTPGLGGALYNFDWTSAPGGSVITDGVGLSPRVNNSEALGGPIGERIGPGTYGITVTNTVNNCSANGSVDVLNNAPSLKILGVSKLDKHDCAPLDGNITVSPSANLSIPGVYTFTWTKGGIAVPTPAPDSVLNQIDYGDYTVAAQKVGGVGSGCVTAPFPVTILDLTANPAIDIASVANVGCTSYTGQLAGTVNGGTAGYAFEWFTGINNTNPVNSLGAVSSLTNINGGDYTLYVNDILSPNRNCNATATTNLQNITTVINSHLSVTPQTLCTPLQDGQVVVTTIDETIMGVTTSYNMANPVDAARFQFKWYDGANVLISGQTLPALSNLAGGTYAVQATNNLGCAAPVYMGVVDNLTTSPVITVSEFRNPGVCILPAVAGMISVEADGGTNTSIFNFKWYIGNSSAGAAITPDVSRSVSNAPITLSSSPFVLDSVLYSDPATFTVSVENATTKCFTDATFKFKADTVTIRTLASAVPLTSCSSDNGGLFSTVAQGRDNLYSYEWFAGAVTTNAPIYTTQEVTSVPVGLYTVRAKNANPGFSFCPVTSDTARVVNDKRTPAVTITPLAPLTYCDPLNPNGAAKADVGGKIVGYIFDWLEGAQTNTTIYFTGSEANNLKDATYFVRATDVVSDCAGFGSIKIEKVPDLVLPPDLELLSDRTDCELPNGALSASVGGITKDYTFQWYNGASVKNNADGVGEVYSSLDAGNYTATATDRISGCTSPPATKAVKEVYNLPDFDVKTLPTVCDESNVGGTGYATIINLDNDVKTVEWDINDVTLTQGSVSDLAAGDYSITVISSLNCKTTKGFTIKTDINIYNAVSRNGDGVHEFFEIGCIDKYPNNSVKIFNRAGTLVYEHNHYDNGEGSFEGVSNKGINLLGTDLPVGTYFYIIDKGDGSEVKTGYLELLR